MICAITGVLRTPDGVVHPSAQISFRRAAGVHYYADDDGTAVVVPEVVSVTSAIDGSMAVSLYPGRYQVELTGSSGSKNRFTVNVPEELDIDFAALLSQAPEFTDGGQLNTMALYAAEAHASEVAAAASAAAAAISEGGAQTAEGAALDHAIAALGYKNQAATSEYNAGNSATAAADSATASETSRQASETAKNTATTQAGIATTKAGEASTSAAAAASSASAADTSKNNAATSETNAAASAAAAASSASVFTGAGIGIVGSVALLASVDAYNTATGVYRFDGTTTGVFPTGVSAANTGIIEIWREDAGSVIQFLYLPDIGDKQFYRRYTGAAWTAWCEMLTVNQDAVDGDLLVRVSGAWTRLAKGSALQVLRMNAGATAQEWVDPPGWTTLGTITTTSGTSQSLSSLTLTGYKQLLFVANGVSHNNGTAATFKIGGVAISASVGAPFAVYGQVWVDLTTSRLWGGWVDDGANQGSGAIVQGNTGYTTATTSVTVACSAGSFDLGSVRVVGIK